MSWKLLSEMSLCTLSHSNCCIHAAVGMVLTRSQILSLHSMSTQDPVQVPNLATDRTGR